MVVLEEAPVQGASLESGTVTTPRWRRLLLPVTYTYAALLVAVTVLVSELSDDDQSRVVLHASTNLHNLLRGHIGTLLSSAFVIGDSNAALMIIPLLFCVLALAELRFGSRRLLRVFVAGHIGATLLVAIGLWVAVEADWLPWSISQAEDVGISYGAMALIGAFIALLPSRWRPTWAICWLAVAVAGVAMGRTFTNVGHLLAVAIGLAAGFWWIRSGRLDALRRLSWPESGLLGTGALLGYLLLVG
ncbi:rhomboid-like protein [Nocardia sp. BMG111209]|uniref:rhomboid-like protein n=1 Tax=Nocardia sp. BMG111209 TaxID=1160137 RepID=UPI000363FAA7|nr:rhomboid-like protein [Nocardia sp. BMG111209]